MIKDPKEEDLSEGCKGISRASEGGQDVAGSDLASSTDVSVDPYTVLMESLGDEDETGCDQAMDEEETKLRKEREEREQEEVQNGHEVDQLLRGDQMKELDTMLNQTSMYTKFLKESIGSLQNGLSEFACQYPEGVDEDDTSTQLKESDKHDGGKTSEKRKMEIKASSVRKRQKQPEVSPTKLHGVQWLVSLYRNGLNGILADEMGLGKTTIGLFAFLRSQKILGPFIVIAPLSTLMNWVSEFRKFSPSLPCQLYHGSKLERAKIRSTKLSGKISESFPVIVTTYEIIMKDISFFMRFHFKSMIVDEGHRLKNHKCKLIRQLREINAANKVLLTGTPLQNNLSELWSILNFILPNVFSRLNDFESWFDFSSARQFGGDQAVVAMEQRDRVVSKLHEILQAFFLRRLKSDVNLKLPAKQEIILYATMTEHQKEINRGLLDSTLEDRLSEEKAKNCAVCVGPSKLRNILMQMRKNSNHPDLIEGGFDGSIVYPPVEQLVKQCGKLHLMDRILNKLKKAGHKVLIFSQMKRMLDIMDYFLQERGLDACRIDGSIDWRERQEQIDRFNQPDGPFAFLLSTRAGGLGINLTAADTVIIYDSDWNPQQDLQAMDRCHRIGQPNPVLVLRLITQHSVDGKMMKRASDKMVLERLVMKQGAFVGDMKEKPTSMSAEELLALLRSDVMLDDIAQKRAISDEALDRILDRTHLREGKESPYKPMGEGYEVVKRQGAQRIL